MHFFRYILLVRLEAEREGFNLVNKLKIQQFLFPPHPPPLFWHHFFTARLHYYLRAWNGLEVGILRNQS